MNKDWKYYFYEISKIPRKSGNEEKIKEYLIKFAIQRNLKYYTDEQKNVIIWKDSNIKEKNNNKNNNEILGLQAHVDMVCEKTKQSNHDFYADGIDIIEENGMLKAKDTTLGADNGIGVAYILAILDSTTIEHPDLEAIFTTQEETTMNGVRYLDENKIKSKKIISFDNFNENELWIGSASSQEWYTVLKTNRIEEKDINTYKISLKKFIGGHAGMDIGDEKRGNPIKAAFEILEGTKVYINSINAGSLINVIPRECDVIFSVKQEESLKVINIIKKRIEELKKRYINESFILNKIAKDINVMDYKSSQDIINCINDFKVGAVKRDKNKNVIVGVNLSKLNCNNTDIEINFCVRGIKRNITEKFIEEMKENTINKYKLITIKYDEWSGYEQSKDSELVKICEDIYINEFNKKINVLSVQACLECEFLGKKIKDLQYVAIGTNTFDVHSVNERIEIKSIEKTWKIILEILKKYNKIVKKCNILKC